MFRLSYIGTIVVHVILYNTIMRLMRRNNYLQIPMYTTSVFIVNSFFIEYLYKTIIQK